MQSLQTGCPNLQRLLLRGTDQIKRQERLQGGAVPLSKPFANLILLSDAHTRGR